MMSNRWDLRRAIAPGPSYTTVQWCPRRDSPSSIASAWATSSSTISISAVAFWVSFMAE